MLALRFERGPRRFSHREAFGLVGLGAAVAALALPSFPAAGRLLPGCAFRTFTGYPCGSCGFTRAFVRAAHLDVVAAFAVSPFGAALFYAWVLGGLVLVGTWLFPALPRPVIEASPRARRGGATLLAVMFLANWAYLLVHRWLAGASPA